MLIKKMFYLSSIFLISLFTSFSQNIKEAAFSTGKINTDQYEEFSFLVKDNKASQIIYRYGKLNIQKDMEITYLGNEFFKNRKCFKIKFPNNYELYLSPDGVKLEVFDKSMNYNKTFLWKYEGPIEGRGTFCDICAQNENEAIDLINNYFIK
jgi:hypothetical protein